MLVITSDSQQFTSTDDDERPREIRVRATAQRHGYLGPQRIGLGHVPTLKWMDVARGGLARRPSPGVWPGQSRRNPDGLESLREHACWRSGATQHAGANRVARQSWRRWALRNLFDPGPRNSTWQRNLVAPTRWCAVAHVGSVLVISDMEQPEGRCTEIYGEQAGEGV